MGGLRFRPVENGANTVAPMNDVLSVLVVVASVAAGATYGLRAADASPWRLAAGLLLAPSLAAIYAAFVLHRDGTLGDRMRLRAGDFSRGFFATLATFGALWAAVRVLAPPRSPKQAWLAQLYLHLGDPSELRARVPLVLSSVALYAVASELVWRALVPRLLEARLGTTRAWVASVALAMLAHAPLAWALADPAAGLNAVAVLVFAIGAAPWAWLARRSERLWPSIFSNALYQWTWIMMFRLWGPGV